MEIIIDGVDFWSLQAMKYWSFPKSYDAATRKTEAKNYAISGNYLGSRKMDGTWNMIICDMDGKYHMRSRTESVNGGFVDKAEWIPHIIKGFALPKGSVILGEIYFPDNEGSRKVTSVLNCLKEKCLERQESKGYLHFYAFDIIAWNGKSVMKVPFEKRINKYLNENFKKCVNSSYIEVADYKEGDELWELYCDVIASGGEGIVITKKSAEYCPNKRTARMTLKMKKELQNTIDAFIDGDYKKPTKLYSGKEIQSWNFWENEKTGERYNVCKYSDYIAGVPIVPVTKPYYFNWASAISLSVMRDNKPVHIAWISGITDKVKETIVNNPKELIGKVVELTAMEIENIDGEYSLRHAKIEKFREDKSAKDCEWSQIEQ